MKDYSKEDSYYDPRDILLVVLPYWDPLIPPQGISYLKQFLQQHGYRVVTKDVNTVDTFKRLYNAYFSILKRYVPPSRWGNFYNIGHDVMRNHMMAFLHQANENQYIHLVKELVYHTYYTKFNEEQILELNHVLSDFYSELENYAIHLIETIKPGVLGISVLRDTIGPSLFMFKLAKTMHPRIKTVMGGSIFSDHLLPGTPNFESFLEKTPYIDHIIIGEGQLLFLKLLQKELPGHQRVFTLNDINGETLDFTPTNIPDMSDFNVGQDYPYLAAASSSSCPYQCSFCNEKAFWGKYKKRDPKQTVEHMISLYKTFGVQLFIMTDSLLNYTITDLSLEFLKKNVKLYWDGYLRCEKAVNDLQNTMLWRRAGFYRARLGIESGSPEVLRLMNKQINIEQIKSALYSLANAGIKTTTYWVIGHPGETEEHFLQTLDLIEESKNYIYEAECNAFIYAYSGQSNSDLWKDKSKLLYPEHAKDTLILQTWTVNDTPTREETFSRINRFVQHCNKLGIPNPYTLYDIYKADERWKKLHVNAVPGLVNFKERSTYIDDTPGMKELAVVENILDDGDFAL
jgi:radical SAM superfamily enzyme YgiQ (UPF0313 family)